MRLGALRYVGLCLVVTGVASCGGSTKDTKSPSSDNKESGSGNAGPAEVGKAAPDLSIQTVNGKGKVSIESLSGKIAVVDFWATWCGPCKQSFPKLEELSKKHGDKVQFVGVSVDDDKDGVADFAKSNGATFPIGWDDGHSIANRWKVEKMPTTFILDSSGTVRYVHSGYHDEEPDQIDKELITLVSEPPGKAKSAVASADKDKDAGAGDKPADKTDTTASTDTAATDDPPPKKKPTGKKKPPGKKPPPKKAPAKKADPNG